MTTVVLDWVMMYKIFYIFCTRHHWSANNPVDVFLFYFEKVWKLWRKCTQRLILSPGPSHRPAACVATHWFATLIQVITIHHFDWINTFLMLEGLPQGGGFNSWGTVIQKTNYTPTHSSKHILFIHVTHEQTKGMNLQTFRFITWRNRHQHC